MVPQCFSFFTAVKISPTKWGMLGKLLLTNGIKWRYEVYRIEYRKNPIVACLMTIRNMWYGVVKWMKYVTPGVRPQD